MVQVAIAHVMERLQERGFLLFDVQFLNDHTERLGALEIPRSEYLQRLRRRWKWRRRLLILVYV